MDGSYVLVTPAHNERELLPDLATTVRAQELRPALWLIVDDGSTDGSAEIIDDLRRRDPWIHAVHLDRRATTKPSPSRYSEVVALGFQTVAELAEAEGVQYRYLANLDADVRCPPALMAELVSRAGGDRMVGIASCVVVEERLDGELVAQPETFCGAPRGGVRLWRRECLEQIAFYPTPHWASVTGLRARNRGWKTIVHDDLAAEAVRAEGTRDGWWAGYRRLGQAVWHVGLHPALAVAQAVSASTHDRDLRGLALIAGYLESALRRRRRCHDPEVLAYYGEDLPRERLGGWLDRLTLGRARRR